MPTYTPIAVRSPRFVERAGLSGGEVIDLELFIWNEPNSEPASANYSFTKTCPSTQITTVSFDISPYCRDFIEATAYTDNTSETQAANNDWCYCRVKLYEDTVLVDSGAGYTYDYIAFNGFGYFTDGKNPSLTTSMLDEGTYYANESGNPGGIGYFDDGTTAGTGVQMKYTGLTTGGTTTLSANYVVGYFPMLHPSYASEGNTAEYLENGTTIKTYTIEAKCEPKYTPIDCDFINRYGFWQRIVFFKNNTKQFTKSGTEFNLMAETTNYSTSQNRRQHFNINAKETVKCNTDWVDESYSETIKDLLLSEKVRLDGVPVNVKTGGVQLFQHITEKNINYEIEFEYAHNQRNYNT